MSSAINDDPRLNYLIHKGKEGDIVIVGAPFDYTRKRTIHKGGQDNAPCCLRRFFPKVGPLVNPQYAISIEQVKVTDYGNIQEEEKDTHQAPEKAINKVSQEIYQLIQQQRVPFVFGGAKEGTYGSALAFKKCYQNNYRHILIAGKPTLKRPYDGNKLTSDNLMTLLTQKQPSNLTVFGSSMRYYPQQYDKNSFQIISYEQIRKTKTENISQLNTQAGEVLSELLHRYKDSKIHITLSVQAIQRFRGCRDVLAFGLTIQQAMQMFFLMGTTSNVLLIDIAQFNPSVQDYQSSLALMNLLYYFLMGWTKRPK